MMERYSWVIGKEDIYETNLFPYKKCLTEFIHCHLVLQEKEPVLDLEGFEEL